MANRPPKEQETRNAYDERHATIAAADRRRRAADKRNFGANAIRAARERTSMKPCNTSRPAQDAGLSDAARTCLALALVLVSSHVLNTSIFPAVAEGLPAAREVSTYGGVAFSVFLAVAAYRKPSLLRERFWSIVCLGATAVAAASLYGGISGQYTPMLAMGSPFGGIGGAWVSVLVGVSLAQRGPKQAALAVPAAFVMQYAANAAIDALCKPSIEASIALYAVTLAAACLLARSDAHAVMKTMRDANAPEVLNVTSPSSYLPFSHLIFVSIMLFNVVCGYSLASSAAALPLGSAALSCLPVAAVLVATMLRRSPSLDTSYRAAVLCIIAGLLAAPFALPLCYDAMGRQAHDILLSAGSDLFSMLAYCIVAAVGYRNKLGAVFVASTVLAAQWLGIGIGAPIAQAAAAAAQIVPSTPLWTTAALAFVFIAYNYVTLRNFGFDRAIESVLPAHVDENAGGENSTENGLASEVEPSRNQSADAGGEANKPEAANPATTAQPAIDPIDEACLSIACACNLTNRETDVLRLLARGRTSPFIQEKLVLSRNTVKTHVRHIYTKLDVHSHQELISKVEKQKAGLE